jgi:hypothetical protein
MSASSCPEERFYSVSMQTDLQSTTLARSELTLPFPQHLTEVKGCRAPLSSCSSEYNLFKARSGLMQSERLEHFVWLALMLSSLGVLLLSFLS